MGDTLDRVTANLNEQVQYSMVEDVPTVTRGGESREIKFEIFRQRWAMAKAQVNQMEAIFSTLYPTETLDS